MACVKYALVYEKDGKFFGSETGIPDVEKDTDLNIDREYLESFKLVYATKTEIKGSVTGIPTEDDVVIYSATTEEETSEEDNNSVAEEEEDITEDIE